MAAVEDEDLIEFKSLLDDPVLTPEEQHRMLEVSLKLIDKGILPESLRNDVNDVMGRAALKKKGESLRSMFRSHRD